MIWIIVGCILSIWGILTLFNSLKFFPNSMGDFFVLLVLGLFSILLSILSFIKYKKQKKQILNKDNKVNLYKSKKSEIILIIFTLFICFILSIMLLINNTNNITEIASTSETSVELIENSLNISSEKATAINEILLQCGVDNISSIEYSSDFNNKNVYSMKFKNGEIAIHIKDDTLEEVYFLGHALYKNNLVESTISDYVLTSEEKVDLQMLCEKAIKNYLVSPSTAEFASYTDWKYSKRKETILVQAYVDSENLFGANVRSNFQFIFKDNIISSLIIDGQEYIEQ